MFTASRRRSIFDRTAKRGKKLIIGKEKENFVTDNSEEERRKKMRKRFLKSFLELGVLSVPGFEKCHMKACLIE